MLPPALRVRAPAARPHRVEDRTMPSTGPPILTRRAFSLIELVVVVAILGCVALIALPRMSSAASSSILSNARANVALLERAIGLYAAEHDDRSPANLTTGVIDADEASFIKRLVRTTDFDGTPGTALMYGPYMADIPYNPVNGRRRIRVNGAPAGANTHGWRYDTATRAVEPDDLYLVAVLRVIGAAGPSATIGNKPGESVPTRDKD